MKVSDYILRYVHFEPIYDGIKDKIDVSVRYNFYGIFATISVFKGKSANAILYCNEIKSLKNDPNCSEEMADKVEFYYNFLLGYAQMYNEQEKDARVSALKAIEAAKKTGSEEYNQKLSEQRANKVIKILVKKYNIDASRLKLVANGSTTQPYPNNNSWNRVVVFQSCEVK